MLELLHSLANQAGMSRINVSIQTSSETNADVVIQCIPNPLKKDAPEETVMLRDTLARPIVISGHAGELEAKLDDMLADYVKIIKPYAASLEVQLDETKEELSKASSAKKPRKGAKSKPSSKLDEKLGSEVADVDSNEPDFTSSETTSL